MTQEDILEMAREAGLTDAAMELQHEIDAVMRFAEMVAAAEREACAKTCDQIADDLHPFTDAWYNVCASAADIRARGAE